jgi:hypothetical protein
MKTIAIMTVAGLAAVASAQSISVHFSADRTQAFTGDVINWTVTVSHDFTGSGAYFGGLSGPQANGFGNLLASDNTLGTASNMATAMAGVGVAPTANGASVSNVNVFNSALLGTNNPANPFDFYTFSVTASDQVGDLTYSAAGVWSMFPNSGPFTLPVEFTNPTITSDLVQINVPTPGALALLGLGGLTAARRRR